MSDYTQDSDCNRAVTMQKICNVRWDIFNCREREEESSASPDRQLVLELKLFFIWACLPSRWTAFSFTQEKKPWKMSLCEWSAQTGPLNSFLYNPSCKENNSKGHDLLIKDYKVQQMLYCTCHLPVFDMSLPNRYELFTVVITPTKRQRNSSLTVFLFIIPLCKASPDFIPGGKVCW